MKRDVAIVTKANTLIEARHRLSIGEQRLMAMLISQIHPEDEDFKPYVFRVAEFEKLIADGERKRQRLYSDVREMTRTLVGKVLQLRHAKGFLQVAWLSSANYMDNTGEVEIKISPDLKPYLLQLKKRFTTYKLFNVLKLRSRYSVRLYELLKQYAPLSKRIFELCELRKILGLRDNEYIRWCDFRIRVIEVAKRELPKKTDLAFDFTPKKRGRAVAWIEFKIFSSAKQEKKVIKKRIKILSKRALQMQKSKALKCWKDSNGSCSAIWENHKDPNNSSASCHWCPKFEKLRLEAQGQLRIPGA